MSDNKKALEALDNLYGLSIDGLSYQGDQACHLDTWDKYYKETLEDVGRDKETIRTALEATQWKPIETAPEDDSNFLVYMPNAKRHKIAAVFRYVDDTFADRRGNFIYNATHWMPLPKSPE